MKSLDPRAQALAPDLEAIGGFIREMIKRGAIIELIASVVALLQQGVPYREIHKQTGVSVTTIGRVARYLLNGNGGYTLAAERMKDSSDTRSPDSGRARP